jgi:hypothetical protein
LIGVVGVLVEPALVYGEIFQLTEAIGGLAAHLGFLLDGFRADRAHPLPHRPDTPAGAALTLASHNAMTVDP